jgi:prepilin-type N-terminal cleavage/methylation domain-containing protein
MALKQNKNSIGFTLIELLVVVAIIGMLLSVIMVSFGQARLRSRDAKRLSDIQQIKTGLDLFFTTGGGYPDAATWNSGALTCSGQKFMDVPRDPLLGTYYVYTVQLSTSGCGGSVYRDYKVEFATEGQTELGPAETTFYLSPRGISTTDPF